MKDETPEVYRSQPLLAGFPTPPLVTFCWQCEIGHGRSIYAEISKLYRSCPPPNQSQQININQHITEKHSKSPKVSLDLISFQSAGCVWSGVRLPGSRRSTIGDHLGLFSFLVSQLCCPLPSEIPFCRCLHPSPTPSQCVGPLLDSPLDCSNGFLACASGPRLAVSSHQGRGDISKTQVPSIASHLF